MLDRDQAAAIAATVLRLRRDRSRRLPPEIFGEPAWDLLLELFVADAKGIPMTASEVGRRCSIKPIILSRWLKFLSKQGMIDGDGEGDLDDSITLAPHAISSIEILMHGLSIERAQLDVR